MMVLGPWRFTDQDARRTVESLVEVVAHAAHGRSPEIFHALREEALRLQADPSPLRDRLGQAWALMTSIRDVLRRHGALPASAIGQVHGLFVSDGGVPKNAIDSATVTFAGVSGDRQATRLHHGRPWQALCLWSTEVVTSFADAGHPLSLGAAGENVSLRGLFWASVQPGVRLRLGEVLCEVSTYSIPCRKNAQWFLDGRFNTMHHAQGPVSRVYAIVLEPGWITVGDSATLEP